MRLSKERIEVFQIPNDPDSGFVNIKFLDKDSVYRIEQATSSHYADEGGKQRFTFDPQKREEMFVEESVVGWGNLFEVNGKELKFSPFNLKNKSRRFVILVNPEEEGEDQRELRFFAWIQECRKKLSDTVEEEEKVAKGN